MKTQSYLFLLAISLWANAGEFVNLSFDNPLFPPWIPDPIPGPPFFSAPPDWMAPGWEIINGVGYNWPQSFSTSSSGLSSLADLEFRETHFGAHSQVPVVGNFSLAVWPFPIPDGAGGLKPFLLSQTGSIPGGALSLRFLYNGDDLRVYVGGEQRALFSLPDVPSGNPEIPLYHYFAVDVSPFAGTTAELKFEFRGFGYDDFSGEPRPIGYPNAKSHVLDDLTFSTSPVPEPSTWALLGLGGLALGWASRQRGK